MNVASCLVVLSSLFIWSITSQTIIKTAKLTPIQTYDQGARVLSSVQDAPPTQNGNEFSWDVNIQSQKGWQFVISVDPTFGFDPYQTSAISITLNGPSAAIGTDELLFGVTNNNANYFSLAIPITPNYKRQARVYPPTCNVLAMGDVAALPQFNRNCDVAGGSCSYWQPTLPLNRPQFPLTITFENDPINRHMNVYAITANFYKTQLTQCPFLSFEAQRGLKVYFAGNRPGDSMVIDSFDIVSQIVTPEPTNFPTLSPSGHPSVSPTPKPSINPTKAPTPAPTSIPTQGPSTDPSKHPTLMPTHSPSKNPTMKPTQGPTNPTVNPTRFPTLSPSTNPTAQTPAPTHGPSKDPTFNPTVSPTMSTNGPTKSPSLNPTTSAPSPSPTRAHPPGFQWGAHDQLCPAESGTLNMQCKTPKDVLSDTNGRMICGDQADCCMCDKIQCGFNGQNCDVVRFGSSGAFGVKDIQIAGNPIWKTTGAAIDCHGIEGCRDTAIYGSDIQSITCEGRRACKDALISVIDPKIDFVLDCIGRNSCNGLKIELNITGPPAGYKCNPSLVGSILPFSRISCKADGSCENLQIVVNNEGCEKLVVQSLECMGQTACDYASFEFNGDYEISQCECNGSCRRAQGLTKCFQNRRLMKCADFEECANQNEVLTNPQNDFFFECGGYGSCKNSRFELAFNNDAAKLEPVTFVKGIKLGGEHSGVGTTFLFDNQQEEILTVDRIECSGTESCFNTVFVTGYKVAIGEVDCAYGACAGCLVKTFESDEGIPCDPQQVGVPM